jgi:uncharacterized protein (UPF0335 family)
VTAWGDLFERAEGTGASVKAVREALAERRKRRARGEDGGGDGDGG